MSDDKNHNDIFADLKGMAIAAVLKDLKKRGYEIRDYPDMEKNGMLKAHYCKDSFIFNVRIEMVLNPSQSSQVAEVFKRNCRQNRAWLFNARVLLSESGTILLIEYDPIV